MRKGGTSVHLDFNNQRTFFSAKKEGLRAEATRSYTVITLR